MIIEINNILPISVNAAYRTWKGRILISVKGREFKKFLINAFESKNIPKIEGVIGMDIEYFFKDRRNRDIDNYQKILIDCMKDILFEDDKMIYNLNLKKNIGCKFNKIIIKIYNLDNILSNNLVNESVNSINNNLDDIYIDNLNNTLSNDSINNLNNNTKNNLIDTGEKYIINFN